jgi:hypothetical protein
MRSAIAKTTKLIAEKFRRSPKLGNEIRDRLNRKVSDLQVLAIADSHFCKAVANQTSLDWNEVEQVWSELKLGTNFKQQFRPIKAHVKR